MTTVFLVFAASAALAFVVAFIVTLVEVDKLQSSGHMKKVSNPALLVFSVADLFAIDLSQSPADVQSRFLSARKSVASIFKVSCFLGAASIIFLVLAVSL